MSAAAGAATSLGPAASLAPAFSETLRQAGLAPLVRDPVTTLQVNVGRLCNLACHHCHVEAGPKQTDVMPAEVVAKQEFAGRWEYLIDEAVFTAPPHDSWSGAALRDDDGKLCGLGSLVIQGFDIEGVAQTVNMFVPIDLLAPIIDDMCRHGRRSTPPRPWLGVLVHEDHDDQLMIVGVYRNCPADRAGLRPGDVIVRVNDTPVSGLADMFRNVWKLGSAGVEVPLSVVRESQTLDKVVASDDRAVFQRIGTVQ